MSGYEVKTVSSDQCSLIQCVHESPGLSWLKTKQVLIQFLGGRNKIASLISTWVTDIHAAGTGTILRVAKV